MTIQTTQTAWQLADDAIALFLEYRDVHGKTEGEARLLAAIDTAQGIEAEAELRANGEIK